MTFTRHGEEGRTLAEELGIPVDDVDAVLEGGAVAIDGAGLMVAPEGCVMHASGNWYLSRQMVETRLRKALGLSRIIWLGRGLAEDSVRDPDRMYDGTDFDDPPHFHHVIGLSRFSFAYPLRVCRLPQSFRALHLS